MRQKFLLPTLLVVTMIGALMSACGQINPFAPAPTDTPIPTATDVPPTPTVTLAPPTPTSTITPSRLLNTDAQVAQIRLIVENARTQSDSYCQGGVAESEILPPSSFYPGTTLQYMTIYHQDDAIVLDIASTLWGVQVEKKAILFIANEPRWEPAYCFGNWLYVIIEELKSSNIPYSIIYHNNDDGFEEGHPSLGMVFVFYAKYFSSEMYDPAICILVGNDSRVYEDYDAAVATGAEIRCFVSTKAKDFYLENILQ